MFNLVSKLFNKNTGFSSSNDRHSFEYEKVKEGEFALNYLKNFKNLSNPQINQLPESEKI